jgi:predicted nucleic acid-binding protein
LAVGDDRRGPEAALKIYLDSSGLIKLLVAEPGTEEMFHIWRSADVVVSISIGYVEARASLARRLAPQSRARARRRLAEYWQPVETVRVDELLISDAADIADSRRLKALDALHLAAAEHVRDEALVFVTWASELGQAAQDAGFATLPVQPRV